MMEDYRALGVFVAVVDSGSFSATGRRLKLSTSVVSHHISRLEEKLGVSLFFRSTRSLSLTPEGQLILDSARRMVAAAEEALDELVEVSDQPAGALRIAMPAFGENNVLHRAVWAFTAEHKMVRVTIDYNDSPVDLVKDGFDIAVRLGVMKDSALKSRKVGEFHRALVAAPELVKNHKKINTLDDLITCPFIAITMLPNSITLLNTDGQQVEFEPAQKRVEVNTINAAKSAVVAGLGIQHLPVSEIQEELDCGVLVRVLPKWSLPVLGMYAVWPDSGPQKNLTRRFIDYLVAYIATEQRK